MKHQRYLCQEDNLNNPNTRYFWNKKILNSKKNLIWSPIYTQKNNWVVKELKNFSGKILDIGIGYGYLEDLIIKYRLQLHLHGIDISNYAVTSARKKFKGIFKIANINKIPFRRDYFNCVVALDVLEHLFESKLPNALLEVKKILKKDGIFIVSVPLNESNKDKLANGHLREYTADIIKTEIESAGFSVYKLKYLYAFKTNVLLKSIINNIFKFKQPNLIILLAKKI